MNKLKVGILGATGIVGQRFVLLLENHPWFKVVCVAASHKSAGKKYKNVMEKRWSLKSSIPKNIGNLTIQAIEENSKEIINSVDFVFSAFNLEKQKIKQIEELYAKSDIPVISNNSAHRWTKDVPIILPEVNSNHLNIIKDQKKHRNWNKGLIVVKPNCSIQSYVPALDALLKFKPKAVAVTTLQAISGAGKTFKTWPEMVNNVIPYIGGEEKKSEKEPLKIWGKIENGNLKIAKEPKISATCTRVATSNGHMAVVSVKFVNNPTKEQILKAWQKYNPLAKLNLPSAPSNVLKYFKQEDRPQTKIDKNYKNGMGITLGRLRKDNLYHWKFVCLSHNTLRGAAGGAVLTAELLKAKNYI